MLTESFLRGRFVELLCSVHTVANPLLSRRSSRPCHLHNDGILNTLPELSFLIQDASLVRVSTSASRKTSSRSFPHPYRCLNAVFQITKLWIREYTLNGSSSHDMMLYIHSLSYLGAPSSFQRAVRWTPSCLLVSWSVSIFVCGFVASFDTGHCFFAQSSVYGLEIVENNMISYECWPNGD
jgi:hypothetical protein